MLPNHERVRSVTVHDEERDETLRLKLGQPTYGATGSALRQSDEIATGVFARALWIGRKYVVLLTYSQWQTRTGECAGDTYRLCTAADGNLIRRQFGDQAAESALDTLRVPAVDVDGEKVAS
jgi:hypothetical protein